MWLYLEEAEKTKATQEKYRHDLYTLLSWLEERTLCKRELIRWKEALVEQYAPTTVNAMLAAINSFFRFMGWWELRLRPLKLQRTLFYDEQKELTREEYIRLVRTAERIGKKRIAMVLQTICATGIRVSELRFITCDAVLKGRAEIHNKGKLRVIFLPKQLRKKLGNYIRIQKITAGAVFVTKTGNPMDRSNIWREMKGLCEAANVEPEKVFPHNLRHLFARCFYRMEKDLSRLADLLGHSSINTTRIYTAESGRDHAELIGRMGLVIT
ncbi:MAG: tyrosine-type recombinase/integrase [Eubacteriales bacterium]|nr:tyrosine-type recombinase/integrase [Eubacteriales bacterium]